jgi:hypothetical protein
LDVVALAAAVASSSRTPTGWVDVYSAE